MSPINRTVASSPPRRMPGRPLATPSAAATLLALAAATQVVAPALAQEATFAVQSTPVLIYSGESANVNVHAHFPTDMYAFASATLDVHASHPSWSFASSGVIAAGHVLGINASQPHAPYAGVFASSANPFRVWHATFTPSTAAPALVEITASPSSAAVYPSRLTSSSVPAMAKGSTNWIFANPLNVGRWVAAPARGTTAAVQRNASVIGRLTNGDDTATAILMGLLLPAVQKDGDSEVRVRFDGLPDSFTASVGMNDKPGEQMTLNFEYVEFSRAGRVDAYRILADLGTPDESPMYYEAFLGGVRVATASLEAGDGAILVNRLPDAIASSVTPVRPAGQTHASIFVERSMTSEWSAPDGHPAPARILLPDGRTITADSIAIRATRPASTNNIRQIGLGAHVFESKGADSMTLHPAQPVSRR